jgi:hypothetical protein
VAIEHRLGDVVEQSLDTLVPNAHYNMVTGQQIVSVLRPYFSIYEEIAGHSHLEEIANEPGIDLDNRRKGSLEATLRCKWFLLSIIHL